MVNLKGIGLHERCYCTRDKSEEEALIRGPGRYQERALGCVPCVFIKLDWLTICAFFLFEVFSLPTSREWGTTWVSVSGHVSNIFAQAPLRRMPA